MKWLLPFGLAIFVGSVLWMLAELVDWNASAVVYESFVEAALVPIIGAFVGAFLFAMPFTRRHRPYEQARRTEPPRAYAD